MSDDESLFQEHEEAEIHDWASARGYLEPAGPKAYSGKDGVAHYFTVTVVLATATLLLLAVVGTVGLLYYNSWLAANQVRLADVQCESAGCQRLARYLEVSINRSADACNDFYGYVCSNLLYANTFKMMRQQHMVNLTRMLRASPVPRQRQTALQKVTALFCACVSLVSENRSEGADLWAFLVHHGLQPAPVGGKMAHGAHDVDPLETTVRLAVTYGLQPVVSFSSHGAGASGRYHHLDISDDYNTWQVTRQSMIANNDLSSFVSERISVLAPPLEKDAVLELSADVIFTESEVAVFLAQVNKSLEESKQIIAFWTKIKDMGNYSKNSVSSERWLRAIRRGSQPSAAAEDSVYARPLALTLLTRLLSVSGGVVAVRRLLWWGLVRELAPYASGRYLPSDSQALDHFCVRRVAAKLELAIRAVHLFRAVTPSVLSAAENLTEDVRAALKRALLSSSWLRGTTRTKALSKADAMAVTLGFPERFSRESQLDQYFATLDDVRPDKSLSSWLALRHFLQQQQRRAGGDDADVAVTHAHKVNAYYLSGNRLLVPAGIIQEPVYFHDAADAYNYGALGQVEQKRLALELGVGDDPENLADFSAASLAYDAFQSLPDHRRALTVHGFGSEQLFFIGHCVKWCRSLTVHRSHGYARGRSRCIVPLMHMPQFSAAFGCSANAYMNAPSKCSFW
ncbi:neprilysin-1-like isoform X2 [Dermacentor albipictus]|uniref:neprilysin-1-like isoform X2 n=1 Tax=Dermacentor albipictus TaxID=60249 RepID=UPI0031FDCF71